MDDYGKELIMDVWDCDPSAFTRESIEKFLVELCDAIDMVREDLHFWDDQDTPEKQKPTEPHLIGISVCQFIRTSNVVMHTLTEMKRVYFNAFSCKDFDPDVVQRMVLAWSKGRVVQSIFIRRM